MASKPQLVLLGYVDEQITSKYQQVVNFTSSKIGGAPDWCISGSTIPICKRCGRRQSLVIQIYCPLEGSPYHRALFIFACVTQECWNRPHSWTCLRSQIPDPTSAKTSLPGTKTAPPQPAGGESWFEDDDDWGSNDNDGNGNADNYNFASSSQLYLDNMAKKPDGMSNLNNMNSNTSSITEVTQSMESKLNIIEEAAQIDANADVTFMPYFLSSEIEPPEDVSFTDHERELLVRYTHSTGHDFREEESAGGGEGKGDSVYEKDVAIHGDVLLHKFKKRISRSPQQVMRYCREEGSSPLWLRPPGASDVATKCQHCGGSMVFELQLTPQLIIHLRVSGVQGTPLEFGTVAVFTCLASCWSDKDTVRQEAIVVQSEVI